MGDKPSIRNIADLAKMAGVSPGTVSRALSGSSLISARTRERIRTLAHQHDFRPNQMARNLRIQKAGAIGVVIPLGHEERQHLTDPFFMQMVAHLADALSDREQNLLLSRIIPRGPEWLDRLIASGHVDGVIVIGQSDQAATLNAVAQRYRPIVVWGAKLDGQTYCSVGTDNRLGGAMAAEHLLEQGCRSIAFFGDPKAPEVEQRLDGCRSALRKAGLDGAMQVLPVHLTPEEAYRDITGFLDSSNEAPDGIFAASDVIAMNALRALSARGLTVPDDVRIVGFDDLPVASQTVPPLSTVRQDLPTGATLLVDLLFRRIEGEGTASVQLAPELVVRGSTTVATSTATGATASDRLRG